MMTEKKFEEVLQRILGDAEPEAFGVEEDDANYLRDVVTYDEAGVLTRNKGLVVRLETGDEFQITIVQSARANRDEEDE